jgi:carbamoyltransferase
LRVLGVNAIFHDPSAALVIDGRVVAAAEEERFSRRKHGKRPVPFSAWELPEQAARWCLAESGLTPADLDAVGYSYDPALVPGEPAAADDPWDWLRTLYARRAPAFLATALPGLDPAKVRFVPHHVAHAASAALAAPFGGHSTASAGASAAGSPAGKDGGPPGGGGEACGVLVADGRGEATSHLAGIYEGGRLTPLAGTPLPHSLGLMYESLTEHLGFRRSSDEYKVMALASYGKPRFLPALRELVHDTADGEFAAPPIDWSAYAAPRGPGEGWTGEHADLAASAQARLEEVLLRLSRWLHEETGVRRLALAGGVALNCVANSRIAAEGPFDEVWVQPAAGDAGTALGAALHLAVEGGERVRPMPGAALGRQWSDQEIESRLRTAQVPFERPADLAGTVAQALAADEIVAWFQGRSEWGPRALGHRSLLAHPGHAANLDRLNAVKGREEFRPVAPMVRLADAAEIFDGPLPSPYMLFVHRVRPEWRERVPAVVHVDGTARIQTVDPETEPLMDSVLRRFAARTGLPVVVNTSLNTAGRPMVDDPRDALECFGAAPVDLLAIGPYVVRRAGRTDRGEPGRAGGSRP